MLPEDDLGVDVLARIGGDLRTGVARRTVVARQVEPPGLAVAQQSSAVGASHHAGITDGDLDQVVVESSSGIQIKGRLLSAGDLGAGTPYLQQFRPLPLRARVVDLAGGEHDAVRVFGTRGGHLPVAHIGGHGLRFPAKRIAVTAATLPVHVQHLTGGEVTLVVARADLLRTGQLVERARNPALRQQFLYAGVACQDLQAGVAGQSAGESGVLRDGLARRGEDETHRQTRPVRGDRQRRRHPAAMAPRAAGVGLLPAPQREQRVEELGHLGVGDAPHRDAEEAARVHAVGDRSRAVPAGHRLHHDVEEGHRLLAALVETRDHRGVPRTTARCLHVLAELEVAIQHLGQTLGDQVAGEPRRADRPATHRRREGGVVDRPLFGHEVEAPHETACRPRDVTGEDGEQRQHHPAAHARIRAVDDARLRVGAGEVEFEVIVGLGHGDGDLVDATVPGLRLVLIAGRVPRSVRQIGQLRPQPPLRVGHHPLHDGLDRVRAVLLDDREQPVTSDAVRPDLGAQVESDQHRDPAAPHPDVGDVPLQFVVADHLDRRRRK